MNTKLPPSHPCTSNSTLSQCCHAVVALLYPFTWQHTYIPVLPPAMLDIVCTPTPFIVGLLSSSLPRLKELPIEEVWHFLHPRPLWFCHSPKPSRRSHKLTTFTLLLVSTGASCWPGQQPFLATGNSWTQQIQLYCCNRFVGKKRVLIVFLCGPGSLCTAGWWGLHPATQATGGTRACAGQEERAGLW